MKIVPFNKPKSIWEILSECTTEGILDKKTAEETLNPIEKDQVRVSPAFLDTFCSESSEQTQVQIGAIGGILKAIASGHLCESRIVEKKLKRIDFRTLSLISELRECMVEEWYNLEVYKLFKKLLLETADKEIFKLSIELTSMGQWCEELIDTYMIIGQDEEFARYISFGFTYWITKKPFEEAAFRLLELSEDWGTIYLTELLMDQKELLKDINAQRNILIGALKDNSIHVEIMSSLTNNLDLPKLFQLATRDKELFEQLVELFNSMFFDTVSSGGIWELIGNETQLLDMYMDYLEATNFDTLKLLGAKNMYEFMECDETQKYMIEVHGKLVYDRLRKRATALWKSIYSIPLLQKSIEEGLNLYSWCSFIKSHKVVEVIDTCKQLYNQDNKLNWTIEDVLMSIGDLETKREICQILRHLVEDPGRLAEPYLYTNIWGEVGSQENAIINKIKVVSQLPFEEIVELNIELLRDYNPQVRSAAIYALRKRSEEEIKSQEELVEAIIERLGDSPFYIRNDALELCKEKDIRISQGQAIEIEESWHSRNEKNNEAFCRSFEIMQDKLMNIVPFRRIKD